MTLKEILRREKRAALVVWTFAVLLIIATFVL